jgi:plasmid stabilization system protein ParE
MRLVVTDAATDDMMAAASWYEDHRDGLGSEFLAACDVMLEVIREHPHRHAVVHGGRRRALVPRPPYCIYRARQDEVVVLAVSHGRRHPRQWQERRE